MDLANDLDQVYTIPWLTKPKLDQKVILPNDQRLHNDLHDQGYHWKSYFDDHDRDLGDHHYYFAEECLHEIPLHFGTCFWHYFDLKNGDYITRMMKNQFKILRNEPKHEKT